MKLTWKSQEMPIGTLYNMLDEFSAERIDENPVGQRPDVESLEKQQGIIDTIIRGFDIGELKLRTLVEAVRIATGFKYRSIDGGHRKRGIRDFIKGKFKTAKYTVAYVNGVEVPCGNKTFSQLPPEVQAQFSSYKLRFTVYGETMTDSDAGEVFRRTNITTDVNHQEMLNSYEDNLVAKFVRELARPVAGLNNDYHELFTIHYTKKGAKVQDYWSSPSKRLRDDEFISRLLTMLTKKPLDPRWLTSSNQEMESMYVKLGDPITGEWALDPKLAKTHKNAVIEALDFILNYATTRFQISNLKMGIQEFTVISRLYVYFVKTFGRQGFRIDNWDKFYLAVRNSMDILSTRTDITHDNKGDRTVCEAFSQYLTVHNDSMKCTKSIEWLLEGIDIEDCGFVDLDKIRGYTKEQLDIGLRSQGNVDWIWGEPLNIKDAAGGHIVPHCDGGKTIMSNLCVIRKEDNQRMGSMNAHLYKAMVLAELEKAV
jgi:hypothetical protein